MTDLLAVNEVSFRYGGVPVVRDFSLHLRQGEHRLLIGPSGSGKSTIINLLCGFLTPTSGQIAIAGKPLSSVGESERDAIRKCHVGVVFQSLRLISALDVQGNLALAANLASRPVKASAIAHLLETLGIAAKARAKPRQLSQGEAQRAAIARALIVKPGLLIADEPTSALDPANAEKVARLLLALAANHGTSLLIATHDDRLAPFFPERIELQPSRETASL